MKTIIALVAVVAGLGFITPAESAARDGRFGDRRIVERHDCGAPVYAHYTVTKRDRNGRVIQRGWVREPHYCRYDRDDRRYRDYDRGHRHDYDYDYDRGRGPGGFFYFGR